MSDAGQRIERCDGCTFWVSYAHRGDGACHRSAPHPVTAAYGRTPTDYYAYWVITQRDDWCGEFKSAGRRIGKVRG